MERSKETDFTDLFLKNKNKRLKKSFISNPAWGCEWGIEQAENGAPPPSWGEPCSSPRSLRGQGKSEAGPRPSCPASSAGSSNC